MKYPSHKREGVKNDMLSITTISPHQSALLQQGMLADGVNPETGEFDFMNYLLGLQASSLDTPVADGTNSSAFLAKAASKEAGEGNDPLLALFEKKNDSLWNPIFPNGTNANLFASQVDNNNLATDGARGTDRIRREGEQVRKARKLRRSQIITLAWISVSPIHKWR